MTKKLKHLLPTHSILEHCSLDRVTLNKMIALCLDELNSDFKTTIEVNKQLCSVHNKLTHSSYDSFYQIALTDSVSQNNSVTFEDLDNINMELNAGSRTKNYRQKQKLSTVTDGPMNESSFTDKTEIYKRHAELFDSILDKLRGQSSRIRLVKLEAGSSITPHIDYDPSYSVRIIIPILAEKDCVNLFWVKNNIEAVSFEPGKAYFLNTGFKHAVVNYSDKDRYTFMITMKDTKDIDHLLDETL